VVVKYVVGPTFKILLAGESLRILISSISITSSNFLYLFSSKTIFSVMGITLKTSLSTFFIDTSGFSKGASFFSNSSIHFPLKKTSFKKTSASSSSCLILTYNSSFFSYTCVPQFKKSISEAWLLHATTNLLPFDRCGR